MNVSRNAQNLFSTIKKKVNAYAQQAIFLIQTMNVKQLKKLENLCHVLKINIFIKVSA